MLSLPKARVCLARATSLACRIAAGVSKCFQRPASYGGDRALVYAEDLTAAREVVTEKRVDLSVIGRAQPVK